MYSQYRDSKWPKLKLTYFNFRARAETIRYILAFAGIPYEDERIELSSWAELKPKTVFGYLPQLEADGVAIGNSAAIQRYVGRIAGLAGKDAEESAVIDSLADCVTDIRESTFKAMYLPADEKESAIQELKDDTIPGLLKILEDFKTANGEKYLTGEKVTWADLHFAASLESVIGAINVTLSSSLQELYDDVRASPNVSKHIKERPETYK